MEDHFDRIKAQAAVTVISESKANPNKHIDIIARQAALMWADMAIRQEFVEFEILAAYLRHESAVTSHTSKCDSYRSAGPSGERTHYDQPAPTAVPPAAAKAEPPADYEPAGPGYVPVDSKENLRAHFESSPALQSEFNGDFEAYYHYVINQQNVKYSK